MKGRGWAWLGGAATAAVVGILAVVLLTGKDEAGTPRARKGKALQAPEAPEPAAQETPREIALRTLPRVKTEISREEILRLLREAADAWRAKDEKRFKAAFGAITKHGAAVQRLLAEVLLEVEGKEERYIAATALQEVATAEIGPFAVALVKSGLPEEIKVIAIQLLTKFRTPEAAAVFEVLLFQKEVAQGLKSLMIDYFAAVGGDAAAEVLARASVDGSLGELRAAAAKALTKIGTAHAARLLFEAWTRSFDAKQGKALSNYYLLQALAGFDPALLKAIVKEVLRSDASNSHKNVFLSMLAKADKSFALETIKDLLATEKTVSIRQQAIYVLSALGGAEAQEILLDILAKGSTKEVLDSANALMAQEKMDVPFEKVRGILAGTNDPLLRAVLANVLSRYEAELAADPALAQELMRQAEAGMASADPNVRGLSVGLAAQLSRYASDPADRLISLYGSLSQKERDAFPVVFSEMARQPNDPRVRTMLEGALGDESIPSPHRLVAADALMTSGGADLVYHAIGASKDPQLAGLMSGIALSRGGDDAAKRLGEIARDTTDPAKKQIIENQLQIWNIQK